MSAMAAVPTMPEDVQQRAGEDQQPKGSAEDVRAMFAHQ
jgi:hypothetical protein